MTWWQRLVRRERLERELDAELEFHVERLAADYRASGMNEPEARRRALAEFGPIEIVKDDCRRARGTEWLRDLLMDVRIGARLLRKEPAFSAVAIATLAVGLGVNTVFFSIVNTYCLTGLQFPAAKQLVSVSIQDDGGRDVPLSLVQARAVETNTTVARAGFYTTSNLAVRTSTSGAIRRTVAYVSSDALPLIDETPAAGRDFRSEEQAGPGAAVALISADLSTDLFGGAASVGQTIVVDGEPVTVVGVMAAGAKFPGVASVWRPLAAARLQPTASTLTAIALLRGGPQSAVTAQPEIDAALRRGGSLTEVRKRIRIAPLNDSYHARITDPVWVAFITAGFLVVLIACSNVGNLLLARGARRTSEIATRISLGASRMRILRQLLTETLVLVIASGIGASLIAAAALRALRSAIPAAAIPYWTTLSLDRRAVAVLSVAGVFTLLVSGLAPAWHLLRAGSGIFTTRTTTHSRSVGRWNAAFLTVQLALSIVLLCAMDITVQAYQILAADAPPGRVAEVLSAELTLSPQHYATPAAREQFLGRLRESLRSSGEITDVSLPPSLPGSRGVPRMVAGGPNSSGFAGAIEIDAEYFTTLGIPLVTGRGLGETDRDAAHSGVLLNSRLAELLFGTTAVTGRTIRFISNHEDGQPPDARTVAGVVPPIGAPPGLLPPPAVYVPRRVGPQTVTLLVRGRTSPVALGPVLRDAIARLDPDLAVANVLPLTEAAWQARWNGRVSQLMITSIATIGLIMAMVGVAAMTAHRIASRRRELSIRVALGARPAQLIRSAVKPVMVELAAGMVCGGLLARGWQGVTAGNLAAVFGLVVATTMAFSVWPARDAAHADPIEALRSDG